MPINREQLLTDAYNKYDKSKLTSDHIDNVLDYYKDKSDEQILVDLYSKYDKSKNNDSHISTVIEYYNDTPVKKKDESNSSLDISAGPYASGQKPSSNYGGVPYSNVGQPFDKKKNFTESYVAKTEAEQRKVEFEAKKQAKKDTITRINSGKSQEIKDPLAYLRNDATQFGAKVEDMQSAAVKANKNGTATDFQKQIVTDIGGAENIDNKNKAQEMEGYLQTIKSNSATAFASLLKAPKGLALLLASNPLNDKVAKPTNESVPEWTNYLDNIAHTVTDEVNKEDKFIADNLGKETSVSKSFANGDIKNGLHLLGKGMVASLTQLPLYLNPYVLTANTVSAASDEQHNNPNSPNLWSETYKKGFENTLGLMFGNSKVFSDLFKSAGKEGTKVALQEFKKTFGKEAAKAYGSEMAEELTVVLNNRIVDAVNGKTNDTPIIQELTDTALQTAAMTAGFQAVSKLVPQGEIKSSDNDLNKSGISYYQEMLDNHKNKSITLTQQQIDGCKKSIEILNKRVEQYDQQEEDAKSKVPLVDPNNPELPPNTGGSGDLMTPEGMQQAGVEPGVPALDLTNLDPANQEIVDWYKKQLGEDLSYYTEKANKKKPKTILQKGVNVIDKLLGGNGFYKNYTDDAEDVKRQLDLLESDPIAFFEEKLNKANEIINTAKDEELLSNAQEDFDYYNRIIEGLTNNQQSQEQSSPNLQDLGINADENNIVALTSGKSIEILGIKGDVAIVRNGEQSIEIPLQDILNEQVGQETSATEGVIQEIIDSNTPVTDIEGNPVNLEEALASNIDPSTLILTDENRTVEDVIAEAEGIDQQEQQVPQTQEQPAEQIEPTPTELPKKIFHATNAQFEGQPTRQEESKVSAFGTEPAGVFYSTNPDLAKQAIGDGENARIVEADFNPKNPLVIKNVDDEVYFNTSKESEQQAVNEFFDEYADSGVDLTEEAANENLPGEVKKRATEIFAEKLKEQGFDAVINQESGDIIVLDPSAVVDSYTVDEADMNNVDDSQAEIEYDNYYDNLGLSEKEKEIQSKIDSIDDALNEDKKPLSNTAKFRLKDMSTLLLKGDIYGLVNLALLNIKTPILLKDGVLNNGTKVKGIGVNKKDTWITTSTDANKAMSYDKLIDLVTEYVTDQVGQVSQTDEQGNASVAELVANADIANMVYDIITGSKEDVYNTLRKFTDQEVDVNALMAERARLDEELANEGIWEDKIRKESPANTKLVATFAAMNGGDAKAISNANANIKDIFHNFDNIIEQLGFKKDC